VKSPEGIPRWIILRPTRRDGSGGNELLKWPNEEAHVDVKIRSSTVCSILKALPQFLKIKHRFCFVHWISRTSPFVQQNLVPAILTRASLATLTCLVACLTVVQDA
jgi:hypothetical protein